MKGALYIIILLLVTANVKTNTQTDLCTDLANASLPFSLDPGHSDPVYLDTLLREVNILALGESNHGTGDFFKTKSLVIKYCVSKLGYRSIGIEADFAGTRYLNNYITKGTGTIEEGLYKMGIAAWMTREMIELVEWLSLYNADKTDGQKVIFWGFDMQFSRNAVDLIKAKCQSDKGSPVGHIHYLDSIVGWRSPKQVDLQKWQVVEAELNKFASLLPAEDQSDFTDLLMVLKQNISYARSNDDISRLNIRDSCMAGNIKLMFKRNRKTIIWAHNEHIAKSKNRFNWQTMGQHLSDHFKEQYYAVGLMAGEGSIGFYNSIHKTADSLAFAPDKNKRSYDRIFNSCHLTSFFLDLKMASARSSVLSDLILKEHFARAEGLTYNPAKQKYETANRYSKVSLYERYDAVIFLKHTSASTPSFKK